MLVPLMEVFRFMVIGNNLHEKSLFMFFVKALNVAAIVGGV